MFKKIILSMCLVVGLNAAYLNEGNWKKGESFLTFLEENHIPLSIYYDMDREDRELATEIQSGTKYQELKDDSGDIEQVLIPVGEELQLHLIRDKDTKEYSLRITPVAYQLSELSIAIDIKSSPYKDIINATNSYSLANEFISAYKRSVNFKDLKKGDKLAIFYEQRKKLGKSYGTPLIKAAMVELGGKKHYVFLYDDDRYYTAKGKEIEGYIFGRPLSHFKRISSKFTLKRWHPILKRYRAHLGIDYAAKRGTPVKAAGDGRITFRGRKSGYGKILEIKHVNGYKTIYAHLNKFKKGYKSGSKVKKGDIVAYVGSTGMSTGPHLHFGLYKNNRAINPNKVIKIAKNIISGKKRKKFDIVVNKYKKRFKIALAEKTLPMREKNFKYIVSLEQHEDMSAN